MKHAPSLKIKAKKIFAYFDKSKTIPELVYRFYNETCAIQVWPYLNFYYLEKDGTRTLRYATPDVDWEIKTFKEVLDCDKRFITAGTKARFLTFWRKRRIHIKNSIREWMDFIPLELTKVLEQWNQSFIYTGRALNYASRSKYYYDLCVSNPSLAYLILRKEDWDPAHFLNGKNPLDVMGEKQEVLAELLGFSRHHAKIFRKIHPHFWEQENQRISLKEFRKILNHPKVLKLVQGMKFLSFNSMLILYGAYEYGWLDRLEVSFLHQISALDNNKSIHYQMFNKGTFERFAYQNLSSDKIDISIRDIFAVWKECMEFNRNWKIKTINSLYYHEKLMIKQMNVISEKEEIFNPISFPLPPIAYQEWNQQGLFRNDSGMTIIPIRNSYELLMSGKEMKNCAYSYKLNIINGDYYCYLLKFDSGEIYMVSFDRYFFSEYEMDLYKDISLVHRSGAIQEDGSVLRYVWKFSEVKGIGNSEPPRHVILELEKWLEWARNKNGII